MKSAYDLLMSAPDEQAPLCKLALSAIARGNWAEAANLYRSAARGGCSLWFREAAELAAAFQIKAGCELSAEQRAAAINEAMLPEVCYSVLHHQEPGRRIVILKRGEAGYYPTEYDRAELPLDALEKIVDRLNDRLGVLPAQRDAMLAGSVFGWHVPGANAATCAELASRAKPAKLEIN